MPTKTELTLEQSQQGVSNEILVSIEGVEELKRNIWIKGEKKEALHTLKAETGSIHMLSVFTKINSGIEDKTSWTQTFKVILFSINDDEWKSFQSQSETALRLVLTELECYNLFSRVRLITSCSYSKTYYKHQDSRIKKAQVQTKTKTSATLIFKIFLKDIKILKTKIVKRDC
ncbi:hypothetical protein Tco_0580624 [Tanacetum coccineum]